jgi:glutaredoxin 3
MTRSASRTPKKSSTYPGTKNIFNSITFTKPTLYGAQGCPYCAAAKAWLKRHNIAFNYVDVSADDNANKDMEQRSHKRGVPQLEYGGKWTVGWDSSEYNEIFFR